jgi:hypothetical protein
VALGAVVAVVRLVILAHPRAPAGIDGGNWLAFGRDLLGTDVRSSTIVYPPVVPLLVTGAVGLLGAVRGIAAVAGLTALAPGVAVYVVLRSAGLRWPAPVLAGLILAASVVGEPAAWGGYPQLLASGSAILFVWALDRALSSGGAAPTLAAGLLLALTVATSHLLVVVAALAGATAVACHLVWLRSPERGLAATARTLAWVVLPSLPFVPLYVRLAGVATSVADRDPSTALGLGDLPGQLRVLYPDVAAIGLVLVVAGVMAPVLLLDRRRTPLWIVTVSSVVATLLAAVGAREARFLNLLPPAAALGVGLWLWDLGRHDERFLTRARNVAVAALVVALVVQLAAGTREFRRQRDYYGILTPGLVSGIDWLRTSTPTASVVAVSPIRDVPLAWWVEGLGRRRTLPASALRWLYFPDERRRARVANEIFDVSFPTPEGMARACAAGADYVLVATDWAGFSDPGLAQVRSADAAAVAFADPDAVVLRTRGSPLCGTETGRRPVP